MTRPSTSPRRAWITARHGRSSSTRWTPAPRVRPCRPGRVCRSGHAPSSSPPASLDERLTPLVLQLAGAAGDPAVRRRVRLRLADHLGSRYGLLVATVTVSPRFSLNL